MAVNVRGPFLCVKAAVHQMQKQRYGKIINIASIGGRRADDNTAAYSASKAAVRLLRKLHRIYVISVWPL